MHLLKLLLHLVTSLKVKNVPEFLCWGGREKYLTLLPFQNNPVLSSAAVPPCQEGRNMGRGAVRSGGKGHTREVTVASCSSWPPLRLYKWTVLTFCTLHGSTSLRFPLLVWSVTFNASIPVGWVSVLSGGRQEAFNGTYVPGPVLNTLQISHLILTTVGR